MKFSNKGVLLYAAAMAVCAFALPSMASASSWGVVGTEHTIHTNNFGFFGDSIGSSSMCASASFTADVVSAAVLEITTATFSGCSFTAPSIGVTLCTKTPRGTNFPWTATAVTTSNLQIHGVDLDIPLETHPSGGTCGALNGQSLRVTGTVSGARWLGNSGARTIEAAGTSGIVAHSALGTIAVTATGTFTDAQGTLTVTG